MVGGKRDWDVIWCPCELYPFNVINILKKPIEVVGGGVSGYEMSPLIF